LREVRQTEHACDVRSKLSDFCFVSHSWRMRADWYVKNGILGRHRQIGPGADRKSINELDLSGVRVNETPMFK
jgi:hypothetical protein